MFQVQPGVFDFRFARRGDPDALEYVHHSERGKKNHVENPHNKLNSSISQYFVDYKLSEDYTGQQTNLAANFLAYVGLTAQIPNLIFNWANILWEGKRYFICDSPREWLVN